MYTIPVKNMEGHEIGAEELPDSIFGIEPSVHAVYQTVKAYEANQREGNASSKNRHTVSGSTAKLFRQKGTGRARAGSAKSPIRVGGGVVFGPTPRSYKQSVPKKVKRLALKSAFSLKAKNGQIVVVDDLSMDEPKTKSVVQMLDAIGLSQGKILFLLTGPSPAVLKSCRNLPYLQTSLVESISVYDVLNADYLLFSRSALTKAKEMFE